MTNHESRIVRMVKDAAVRDGAIAIVFIVAASALALAFDVAGMWNALARRYDAYQLDELPIFLAILALALAWYAVRRWRELLLVSAVRRRLNSHLEFLLSRESLLTRQFREIKAMDEGLLAAEDSRQACEVAVKHLRGIFPFGSGAFFVVRKGLETLTPVGGWGAFGKEAPPELEVAGCRALAEGGFHGRLGDADDPTCEHCDRVGNEGVVCVPITGQGKTFGLLQMVYGGPFGDLPSALGKQHEFEQMCQLAGVVCRSIGQHLANIALRRRLYDESWRDPLTGLLNRRGLDRFAAAEMGRVAAEEQTMAVLMMDVDGFKGVNDRYGHDVGDFVLEAVGRAIVEQCRARDIVCRLGGDEFLAALPAAGLDVARRRAEAIRSVVAEFAASRADLAALGVSLSVGIALFPDHGADWEAVVAAADGALYAAKGAGKDRVAVGEPISRLAG